MKKLWMICLALVLVLTSCGTAAVTETAADKQPELSAQETEQTLAEQPTEEPTEKPTEEPAEKPTEEPAEKPAATTAVPAVSTGPTLEFLDVKTDIYLLIDAPGWAYVIDETGFGVRFYEAGTEGTDNPKTIDIIVSTARSLEIEQFWESISYSMESGLTNFESEKADELDIGGYDGTRYTFVSDERCGDGVFWETDARFYRCIMMCSPQDYEAMNALFIEMLSTFCPASEK